MLGTLDPLVLDLIEWVAQAPRPYDDVIDAWRTSCPRLTVWEDATERGFIRREVPPSGAVLIVATEPGLAFLRTHRSGFAAAPVQA